LIPSSKFKNLSYIIVSITSPDAADVRIENNRIEIANPDVVGKPNTEPIKMVNVKGSVVRNNTLVNAEKKKC
jgi:hypothetical protein